MGSWFDVCENLLRSDRLQNHVIPELSRLGFASKFLTSTLNAYLRKRRDAKPIELLGVYDPRLRLGQEHKTMHWSAERIKYWLERGAALPSKPVVKLLERGGIIPPNSKYHPKLREATSTPSSDTDKISSPSAQPSPS